MTNAPDNIEFPSSVRETFGFLIDRYNFVLSAIGEKAVEFAKNDLKVEVSRDSMLFTISVQVSCTTSGNLLVFHEQLKDSVLDCLNRLSQICQQRYHDVLACERAMGSGTISKLYWPIDTAAIGRLSLDCSWFVSFLESASRENCKAYMMQESVVGAVAASGRSGEIVRREGRGRLWEVVFADKDQVLEAKVIDGSQCASDAVLSWLRGETIESILDRNRSAIIDWPRDFLGNVETDDDLTTHRAPSDEVDKVAELWLMESQKVVARVRPTSELGLGELSEGAVRALYQPSRAFRISSHTYPAGAKRDLVTKAAVWFILEGAGELLTPERVGFHSGEAVRVSAGQYELLVLSEGDLIMTCVSRLPEKF